MKQNILLGTVDYTTLVFVPDPASTDGSGKTGLVAANLTASYSRVETDNDVTVTDVTSSLNNLAALTSTHNDWGWLEVSNTLAPGLYRFDIADAVFASGAWSGVVYVMITTSAAAPSPSEFILVAYDQTTTGAGGIPVVGTGTNNFKSDSSANVTFANTSIATVTTVTTTTNLTNAATAGDFTSTMKTSIGTAVAASAVASVTGNVGGNVVGSVGSVVGAVGSVTGNVGGSTASVVGAVGSVTGNVGGNVTGTVASVVGNVGGNVTGTIGGLTTGALADFFDTDSGKVFGDAVAGSVVKEIADNAAISGTIDANLVEIGGDAQSATDLKDFADAGYDPSTNKVQGLVLADAVTVVNGLAANTVTATAIANDAITAAKIANAAIDAATFAASAIDANALATDAVTEIVTAVFAKALAAGYGSFTFEQAVSIILASQAAPTSGAGSGTFTIRNVADSADVIVASVSGGNRTATVVTP